jgi:DNA-binding MarR family transcriptional regulator
MADFLETCGAAVLANRLRGLSECFVEQIGLWLSEQGIIAPPRAVSTLRLLLQDGAETVGTLARQVRLSHPFLVRLVKDLEVLELVTTHSDPADKRKSIVRLTSRGRVEARKLEKLSRQMEGAYLDLFRDAGTDLLAAVAAIEGAEERTPLRVRLAMENSTQKEIQS